MKGFCRAHLGGSLYPSFGKIRLPFCRSKLNLHSSIGRNADEHHSSRCSRLQAAQTRESVAAGLQLAALSAALKGPAIRSILVFLAFAYMNDNYDVSIWTKQRLYMNSKVFIIQADLSRRQESCRIAAHPCSSCRRGKRVTNRCIL